MDMNVHFHGRFALQLGRSSEWGRTGGSYTMHGTSGGRGSEYGRKGGSYGMHGLSGGRSSEY
jgi:hypothetical protein